jgi:hypothetical protein
VPPKFTKVCETSRALPEQRTARAEQEPAPRGVSERGCGQGSVPDLYQTNNLYYSQALTCLNLTHSTSVRMRHHAPPQSPGRATLPRMRSDRLGATLPAVAEPSYGGSAGVELLTCFASASPIRERTGCSSLGWRPRRHLEKGADIRIWGWEGYICG